MTTGQRIQQERKKAGLSQKQLGEKLGLSASMIGQWENDLRKPKYDTLRRIADALGVEPIEFVLSEESFELFGKKYRAVLPPNNSPGDDSGCDDSIRVPISSEQYEYSELSQKLAGNTISPEELQRLNDLQAKRPSLSKSLGGLGATLDRLGKYLTRLNDTGQKKVEDYAQDLTKIPEYRCEDTPKRDTPDTITPGGEAGGEEQQEGGESQ